MLRPDNGVILTVALVAAAGCARAPANAGGADGGRPVPVTTAAVARRDFPIYLDGLGTVSAFKTVTVRSQVDGRLDQVLFKEGQEVRRGDLLAQVDPRPFLVQLHQAEGALARDSALLRDMRLNLDRYASLQQQKLVSQQQVDDQRASVGQYEGAVRIDQAQVESARLQLNLTIDRDTAARLGIQPQAIDDTLYDAFGQRQVATIFTELNQYRVVLEVKPELQTGPDALRFLYVRAAGGAQVPLSMLARAAPAATSLSVNHQGQFPAITLSFNVAPGLSLGQAVDAVRRAERDLGLPAGVHAAFQGTAEVFRSSLASEPYLILAALLAVYIVLGVLYESYIHPITILSSLPSAGVGALLALLLFRTEFSVIALIGIVLLIGIVKKNAILMIDFALEAEREQGLPPRESIYQACLLRFRPIMMTTMAALLGGLPLALGRGTGSELRRPLGIVIVGGLLLSQLLTLYTTPVIYLALERLARHRVRADRSPARGTRSGRA